MELFTMKQINQHIKLQIWDWDWEWNRMGHLIRNIYTNI